MLVIFWILGTAGEVGLRVHVRAPCAISGNQLLPNSATAAAKPYVTGNTGAAADSRER
jgi:hypothetical protein